MNVFLPAQHPFLKWKDLLYPFGDPLLSQSMNLDICVWRLQRCKHGPSLANQSQSWCFSRAIRERGAHYWDFAHLRLLKPTVTLSLSFWGESLVKPTPRTVELKYGEEEKGGGRQDTLWCFGPTVHEEFFRDMKQKSLFKDVWTGFSVLESARVLPNTK